MATAVKKKQDIRKNQQLVGRKSGRVLTVLGKRDHGESLYVEDDKGKRFKIPNDRARIMKSYYISIGVTD